MTFKQITELIESGKPEDKILISIQDLINFANDLNTYFIDEILKNIFDEVFKRLDRKEHKRSKRQ